MKKIIPAFLLITSAAVAAPDPFMGEGKQGYIERCTTSLDGKGLDHRIQKSFCTCMADHLETGYAKLLSSISDTDTVAEAQRKMNLAGQDAATRCMKILEES